MRRSEKPSFVIQPQARLDSEDPAVALHVHCRAVSPRHSVSDAPPISNLRPAAAVLPLWAFVLVALSGCHDSNSQPPAVVPTTNNLRADVVEVATAAPRVGSPIELVTRITATETTANVSVSYYAQNGDDVAQQREQVRQFYLGTTTFPVVQPTVTEYRAQLTVPSSVTPPGNYVILAAVDPASLIAETDEKDNLVEVPVTFAPLEDPNLLVHSLTLDAQSLLLDADQDDVPSTQVGDVQNADLGATVVVGLEGTLSPVGVEAFVRLRITRTDRPAGLDTYDIPLYLWNSDAQRYVDVFGINGPVEWLPLGNVVPQLASESASAVDVTEADPSSAHLDVYLPGKLAEEMIMILEHLVQGPPPTEPPPDLRMQDILALREFFSGAALSAVRFSIVVDVRATDTAFFDSALADNTAAQPLYLILPGRESLAPDRPIAFEQGIGQRWGSDTFGVGVGFDSLATLDRRGAIAEVEGGIDVEVFGNTFQFMHLGARAQVVPDVDPTAMADVTSGFALDLQFASVTVYSLQRDLGYTFDGTFSVSKEKKVSRTFFLGPVPVSASGGVAGEFGYAQVLSLLPTGLTAETGPYATLEASIEAGVGIVGLRAGAGGGLTLIDERFQGNVQAGLAVVSASAPAVFQGTVAMQVTNTLTGPTGRLFLFVEYPGLKWCRACFLGVCIPYPCGFKIVRKELGLVSWVSFVKSDVLFDQAWCKRVTINEGPSYWMCSPQ